MQIQKSFYHALFVEKIQENGNVLLRNSWGDYLKHITLDKDDRMIMGYFKVRLKQVV